MTNTQQAKQIVSAIAQYFANNGNAFIGMVVFLLIAVSIAVRLHNARK